MRSGKRSINRRSAISSSLPAGGRPDDSPGRSAIKPFERVVHPSGTFCSLTKLNPMRLEKKLLCVLLIVSTFARAEASLPALTAEQWRQDLEFFANEITTKHRDPFHFTSKSDFDQAVSQLR